MKMCPCGIGPATHWHNRPNRPEPITDKTRVDWAIRNRHFKNRREIEAANKSAEECLRCHQFADVCSCGAKAQLV